MTRSKLPDGVSALLLGIVVAVAGSYADNVLGGAGVVTVLQIVLWTTGGILMLGGAASRVALRSGQRAERARRTGGSLRPTVR